MAVTHPTAIRDEVCNLLVDKLDGGTLVLRTAGDVEVATLTFGTPAFGASSAGVAAANAVTADASATGGTATKAALVQTGPTDVILCSVTATGGGGDIEASNNIIAAADTVSLTSLTYESMP